MESSAFGCTVSLITPTGEYYDADEYAHADGVRVAISRKVVRNSGTRKLPKEMQRLIRYGTEPITVKKGTAFISVSSLVRRKQATVPLTT